MIPGPDGYLTAGPRKIFIAVEDEEGLVYDVRGLLSRTNDMYGPSDVDTFEDVFARFGYQARLDELGNLVDAELVIHSWSSVQQRLFLTALLPYVRDGDFFMYVNEDGEIWGTTSILK